MRYDLASVKEVLKHFEVDEEVGLDDATVATRREKYGWNELDKEEKTPLWKLVLEQFDDTLVKILLAAAVVSFLLAFFDDADEGVSAYVEPLVILVILILNAIVGVWQESNAEAALEALKDLQPENARCLRNGTMVTIPTRNLVPGDIVEVRVGDKVPADLRLTALKTTAMRLEQSQLTGEVNSVLKETDELASSSEDVIQSKTNMLFSSTVVVNGIGRGVVVASGMNTEIGKIQNAVQEAAAEDDSTPLKKKLDEFGELLSKVIGIICILVWAINYKNFFDPVYGSVFKGCIYYFKIAVALAVAAIPEGLPAVITTCLALGTKKMAKKNAIVRKLPSVETLGCTTVICSDKTGTLTTNEMSTVVFTHPFTSEKTMKEYKVEGHTYAPVGDIEGLSCISASDKGLKSLATICALCNESSIEYHKGKYVRIGEPTEAALKVLVEKMGVPDPAKQKELENLRKNSPENAVQFCSQYWESLYKKVATLEFSRDRKSMSVLCSPKTSGGVRTRTSGPDGNVLFVKGAPEGILKRCTKVLLADGQVVPLTEAGKKAILSEVSSMASRALRCLALSYKDDLGPLSSYDGDHHHTSHKLLTQTDRFHEIESDMVFVGLAGMLDPPRPEVRPMIETCRSAGIRVIVITGDNKETAEAICRKIGVFDENEDISHKSFTGGDFFALPEAKRIQYLMEDHGGRVFSRTEPKHKQSLVKLLKSQQEIVAMTGDGVNDAPALKQADIGIAMGITGTEVAKEASDMVLADDNFATIVSAVEEGRAIYNNMQAFIRYLISSNIGEVAAIFFTAAVGFPEGLIPVQLLWVNLVTDGPPATALGFNPPDLGIMTKPPRKANDVLINRWVFFRYMVVGIYVGFACVGVFAYWYIYYDMSNDGHTLISFSQLSNWGKCHDWVNFTVNDFGGLKFDDPCEYFTDGKVKASTLSLSVLVTIEMLNALNALSEDGSLVTMPPWSNPYLLIAMMVSFGMHFVILYVPVLAKTFSVTPLDVKEWLVVMAFSVPVIFIDEVLKFIGRQMAAKELEERLKEEKKQ